MNLTSLSVTDLVSIQISTMNSKDYLAAKAKLPPYLEELLDEKEESTLVFQRLKTEHDDLEATSDSTLNLTGCPLEVDLNISGDSICNALSNRIAHGNYGPMSISLARRFINHYNKQLRSDYSKPRGIYCICNAADEKKVVVLGSHIMPESVVKRILVATCDEIEEFWSDSVMDEMIAKHICNIGEGSPKIETRISYFYNVHGEKVDPSQNLDVTNSSGCIAIEADWNTNEMKIPNHGANIKMLIQVVLGYENSFLYNMHQKLTLLHKCINMLRNENLDHNTILNDFSMENDSTTKIKDVLHEVIYKKPRAIPQDLQQAVAYIEESTLTDKLWKILSCSNKLVDLTQAINLLLGASINNEPAKLQLLDDDLTTTLGTLIKNIYEEKMMMPEITPRQSLILLIELGLLKLKKMFLFVVQTYDSAISDNLSAYWSKLNSNIPGILKVNLDKFNLEIMSQNLDFLYSVYSMLEFLQLVEESCFSKELGTALLNRAFDKYGPYTKQLNFSGVKRLLDLELNVAYGDVKLATDCAPLKSKITMTSTMKFPFLRSVKTSFHYSQKAAFPESVYKYKEAEFVSNYNQKYFVTRVETYADKLPV